MADGLKKSDVSWFNTASGSRSFWAVSNPVHTKDNIMTVHPQENIYDDHGELMGARNAGRADIVNLADDNAAAMKALDRVVLDFLNREFAKRKANQK